LCLGDSLKVALYKIGHTCPVHGPETPKTGIQFVFSANQFCLSRILPSASMRVDRQKGGVLLLQVVQAIEQNRVLEYVCVIANVKGMTIREHAKRRS
jgi:hypothetical protein